MLQEINCFVRPNKHITHKNSVQWVPLGKHGGARLDAGGALLLLLVGGGRVLTPALLPLLGRLAPVPGGDTP